jgi:hypothetical protein
MSLEDRLEYTTSQDPFRNYCLWEYAPVAASEDKFRPVNLLYQSFELARLDERAYDVVDALRAGIGPFQTVFGIKWTGERLGWEYYFYDYARRERKVSISRVLDALRPFAPCRVRPNERLPYFMFSIDLDDALHTGARELDVVHVYLGNPGSTVSSGVAYGVGPDSTVLENYYFFFDAQTMLKEATAKIFCSPWADPTEIDWECIVLPELRDCHTICVANKRANDCIYFSGVDVHQLLFFLRRCDYPKPLVDFVETNRESLDHLRYDVGIDYRVEGGELRVLKSGYYGVF